MSQYEDPQLKQFIDDFNLRASSGVISFKAYVEFNMHEFKFQKVSEVQIITSVSTETIYFLDQEIGRQELPDMLKVNLHQINYLVNKMITFTGENTSGRYTITIMPFNQ